MWAPFRPHSLFTWGGSGGVISVTTSTHDNLRLADHDSPRFHRKRMVIGMFKDLVEKIRRKPCFA